MALRLLEKRTRLRTRKPIVLLVRRIVDDAACWIEYAGYWRPSEAAAAYHREIQGRGITAWAWWGTREDAAKMLIDPTYVPGDEL